MKFKNVLSTAIGAISGVVAFKLTTEFDCDEKEVVLATAGAAGLGASVTSMAMDAIIHKHHSVIDTTAIPMAQVEETSEDEESYEENKTRLDKEIEDAIEEITATLIDPSIEEETEEADENPEVYEDPLEESGKPDEETIPDGVVPEGIIPEEPAQEPILNEESGPVEPETENEVGVPVQDQAAEFAESFVQAVMDGDEAVDNVIAGLEQQAEPDKIDGSVLDYVKSGKRAKHPNDTGERASRLERKFQ